MGIRTQWSNVLTLSPHSSLRIQLLCFSTEQAIGGGYVMLDHDTAPLSFSTRFTAVSNGPVEGEPRRWVTITTNNTDDVGALKAYILCAAN